MRVAARTLSRASQAAQAASCGTGRRHFDHAAPPFRASRSLAEALSTSTHGGSAARAGRADPSEKAPRSTARSSGPRRIISRVSAAGVGGAELAPSCRSGMRLRATCCWGERAAASSAEELWSSMRSGRSAPVQRRAERRDGILTKRALSTSLGWHFGSMPGLMRWPANASNDHAREFGNHAQ